jgi:hypothetical protein
VSANPAPTPEKERDEEAIATQSATASTTLAVSNPEAAGAVTYRKPRTSLWAWAGSAALVGLFVAGVSNDLSKDKGPPPEPQPLPDFPDAP